MSSQLLCIRNSDRTLDPPHVSQRGPHFIIRPLRHHKGTFKTFLVSNTSNYLSVPAQLGDCQTINHSFLPVIHLDVNPTFHVLLALTISYLPSHGLRSGSQSRRLDAFSSAPNLQHNFCKTSPATKRYLPWLTLPAAHQLSPFIPLAPNRRPGYPRLPVMRSNQSGTPETHVTSRPKDHRTQSGEVYQCH